MLKNALFYEVCDDKLHCKLCPHHCIISEGNYGLCSVRTNDNGMLKTINYGEITSMSMDPIEKKPLYHFKPGMEILSVGSFGCNFICSFCQNHVISQNKASSEFITHKKLTEICCGSDKNAGIAFTYNEPSIWYEYVYDTCKLLKSINKDMNVVLVTNGYIEKEPLKKLLPYVDAMNIDLKSFNEGYYEVICGGKLQSVLDTIELASKECHIEITTLLVKDSNDSLKEVEEIASFIGNINKDIPLHLSRYFPNYKMNNPATEIETMIKSKEVANKYLNYVYIGNVAGVDNSTYCPKCGAKLIDRQGDFTEINISKNQCFECGYELNIIL